MDLGKYFGHWFLRILKKPSSFLQHFLFRGFPGLQWLTGYLRLTLVFVSNGTQREKFSFCFSRVFC